MLKCIDRHKLQSNILQSYEQYGKGGVILKPYLRYIYIYLLFFFVNINMKIAFIKFICKFLSKDRNHITVVILNLYMYKMTHILSSPYLFNHISLYLTASSDCRNCA